MQAFLNLLGKIADATGIPASRYVVVTAPKVDTVADRNLILIGLDAPDSLLRKWQEYNSVHVTSTSITAVRPPNFFERLFQPFDPRAPYYSGAGVEFGRANLGKPYAYMASYWSPLDASRLVVAIGANQGATLVEMTKQMDDPYLSNKVQGDFFLFIDGKGEFYTSGRRKFVGQLPIWWKIQWLAGSFGPAAFICVICAIIIFALTIRRYAAYRASKLLVRAMAGKGA